MTDLISDSNTSPAWCNNKVTSYLRDTDSEREARISRTVTFCRKSIFQENTTNIPNIKYIQELIYFSGQT